MTRSDVCASFTAGTRKFAQAILQYDRGAIRQECALLVDEQGGWILNELAIFPGAFELGDFLFQSHSRREVGDALIDTKLRIPVGKDVLRGGGGWEYETTQRQKQKG